MPDFLCIFGHEDKLGLLNFDSVRSDYQTIDFFYKVPITLRNTLRYTLRNTLRNKQKIIWVVFAPQSS